MVGTSSDAFASGVFAHPTNLLRQEKRANGFAFSLPQDSSVQLMFGAADFSDRSLSASRSLGFRITPRGIRAAQRRLMRHKCFRQQWILERASARVASYRSNA
jgi:hypothetical protein